ncbi:MAG: DNA primase family protein [Parasphingorhabdus sp.]
MDNQFNAQPGSPDPEGNQNGNAPDGGAVSGPNRGAGSGQSENKGEIVRLRPPADDELDRRCARFDLTDLGNAERFVNRYAKDFRFCPELGWFRWDSRRWELLSEEKDRMPAPVMQAIFATVRAIKNEAVLVRRSGERKVAPEHMDAAQKAHFAETHADRMDFVVDVKKNIPVMYSDKLAEWARSSEAVGKLGAIGNLAKAFAEIVVNVDDFDQDRLAINCLNGTLKLEHVREKRSTDDVAAGKSEWRTTWGLKLHKHRREDLITKITRVKYNRKAKSPVYDAFMAKVQPDPVMARFIAQWGGLSMTGDIGEQKLAFFYGQGRNGKGTWVEAVAWMAGDYAGSLPIESLLDNGKRRGDQATPDIARLPGVRFLRVSEPSKGAVLNEGLVKMVTGGDPVDARHLNKGLFTFLPEFKMTISGNQKPAIRDTSDGIWRRMQLVPWDVQIPREEVDKHLVEKLQAEGAGIFARMMEGLLDWRLNGLIEPEAVRLATSEYRDDSDDLGRFLRECCALGEDSKDRPWRVRLSDLYALFEVWAEQTGSYVFTSRQFSKAMRAKGFKDKHSGGSWWIGINRVVEVDDIKNGTWTAADHPDRGKYDPLDPMTGSDGSDGLDGDWDVPL